MVKNKTGHIINIGSVAGSSGVCIWWNKSIRKFTFIKFKSRFIDKDIHVTSVEPGLAETEFSIVDG